MILFTLCKNLFLLHTEQLKTIMFQLSLNTVPRFMMKLSRSSQDNSLCQSFVYEHTSHQSFVLSGLQSLRERELLFDITLIVDGQRFRAHKTVLAACSDYFRAMFTEPMLESRQNEVTLNGLTSKGFQIVLEYVYTARMVLDQSNVQDVLSVATHVQIQSVVYACSSFLQNQIDIENCVDIANIAENYSLSHLINRVYMFMSSHFIEFSSSHEFYRLSPQQLKTLLACDYPVDCPESIILQFVIKWFLNVPTSERDIRLEYSPKIIQQIHFNEIPTWELESLTDSLQKNKSNDYLLYKTIVTESYYQTSFNKLNLYNNLLNSRGMELALLKIGGFGMGGMTNEITYRLTNERKWHHLTSIPHVEQCNFGTAVFNNELYVIGGCFNQLLQETIHPFGFKYNPCCNEWSTIAIMNTDRCRFSLNLLGHHLYAIGGSTEMENHEDGTSACERYNPSSDSWEAIAPLPELRTQHAGASFEDGTVKKLFISGGLDKDTVLSSVCYYDPIFDSWTYCRPMSTSRADHVMIPMGHKIYVCGGWTEETESRTRVLVDSIDVYDLILNVWEVVTRVPTPRYHAGIVGVEDKIYFIGGFHNDATFDRATATIECYNISTNTWTTEDKYPRVIWEHSCATLYIPKCRDDMEVLDL